VRGGDGLDDGTSLVRTSPQAMARSGIACTFQIVQPVAQMTVLENVMAGANRARVHSRV
jgi:ABC-type branched-subunit amino acid transport system ATPase component